MLARRHHCGCAPRWRRLAAVAPVASTERHGRRDRVQSSLRLSGSRRRCLPAALLPVQGPSPQSPTGRLVCHGHVMTSVGSVAHRPRTREPGGVVKAWPHAPASLAPSSASSSSPQADLRRSRERRRVILVRHGWEYILRRNRPPTTWIATDRSATSAKGSALDLFGQSCGRVLPVLASSMPTSPPPSCIIVSLEPTSVNSGLQDLDYASTPSTS